MVSFLQLAAEKNTPFMVQLKKIFSPSYFVRALVADHMQIFCLCSMAIRVVKFSSGVKRLERFLTKNQHTQRKLLNFENRCNGEVSKSAKI